MKFNCHPKRKYCTGKHTHADDSAVKDTVNVVSERMINPFEIDKGTSPKNKQPLLNITTSTVARNDVTQCLNKVRENGTILMKDFKSDRLKTGNKDSFDPIKKLGLKLFASLKP